MIITPKQIHPHDESAFLLKKRLLQVLLDKIKQYVLYFCVTFWYN